MVDLCVGDVLYEVTWYFREEGKHTGIYRSYESDVIEHTVIYVDEETCFSTTRGKYCGRCATSASVSAKKWFKTREDAEKAIEHTKNRAAEIAAAEGFEDYRWFLPVLFHRMYPQI